MGTILPDCSCGAVDDVLWLYLPGFTFDDAVELVKHTDDLKRIESHYGSLHSTFEDYTQFSVIQKKKNQFEVRLTGGHIVETDVKDEETEE